MTNTNPIPARLRALYFSRIPEKFRCILGEIPRVLLINTLCALLINFVMRSSTNLFESWVFSNCIGFFCYGLIRTVRKIIWRNSVPNTIGFYVMCAALAPFGFLAGTTIAAQIFSYPLTSIFPLQWNYVGTFATLSSLISLVAAWAFWSRIKMTELKAEAETEKARSASIERQALQTQLQLLQAQIEPHMLFNTLANLQGLIALDPARAQHMLAQLIVYLRATLSSSRAEAGSLQQEFKLIQAYLELLTIRMGKRLSYRLNLPPELANHSIPPMLLQPLVENAIKHGLEPKMEGGTIEVGVSMTAGFLQIQVTDNGLGLPFDYSDAPPPAADAQHVGNANIRERLQAIFGAAASLSLAPNTPEGTIATLRLPY